MLNVAIIGSRGHFTYVFEDLENLRKLANIRCISSGSEDPCDRILTTAGDAGFQPAVYDDWKEMLDRERPDVVCVDGPFEKHAEMSAYALRKGIHVFCEKPIALTLEQLDLVKEALAVSPARIISMVGLRYDPAFLQAARMVHDGVVGKIKMITARKSYKIGTRPGFYSRRATYGGTIGWVGSHALDWILYFTGDTFESVAAFQTSTDNFDNGEMEIAASCQFRTKSGILAGATMDFLRPKAAPSWGDDRVRVAGTKAVLEVYDGKIRLITGDEFQEFAPEKADRTIFVDFLTELSGGRAALVNNEETLELTRSCILAQQAADTGKIVYF